MLAVDKKGNVVNTLDFVQDHSECYDECVKHDAWFAIKFADLSRFEFVRPNNRAYLMEIIARIRREYNIR